MIYNEVNPEQGLHFDNITKGWATMAKINEKKRESSQAKSSANARYNEKMVKRYNFGLNIKTDADVIEQLDKQESKQGYIKGLIRKDIQKGGENET